MSKPPKLSKRMVRDGVSKRPTTPAKTSPKATATTAGKVQPRSRNTASGNKTTATGQSSAMPANVPGSLNTSAKAIAAAPKPRVTRAKKLAVRQPNQQIVDRARQLKEKRTDQDTLEPVRIQKALAASGVGSRREMEEWIGRGWVKINGKVAQLGDKVAPQDHVEVKGDHIKLKWPDRLPRILLYYKQEGEIVSRDDPQGRVTIFDRLPQAQSSRWVAIGRLDVNTSGLLILTTSGELVNRFAHPSFEVEREYAVRVLGEVSTEQMKLLTDGIMLDDGLARVERIFEQGGEGVNKWYHVVIKEGRNREVRRIFEHLGLTVSRLVRVGFGPIGLPQRLKRGQFYELNELEVANIMRWADLGLPGERKRR